MPITEAEWVSISTMVSQVVRDIAGTKGDYFVTGKVFKVDKKNKCIYMKEFGSQPIPIVSFNYEVKYYDQTPDNSNVQFATPIGPNAGPGGLSGTFTSDGRKQWMIVTGSGYISASPGAQSIDIRIDGNLIGAARVYINETFSHKSFVPWIGDFTLTPGTHTVTLTPNLNTDGGDFFTAAVISSPSFTTRVKIVPAQLVMPKKGDTVLIAREMGTSRLPRCLGVVQGQKWILKGDE